MEHWDKIGLNHIDDKSNSLKRSKFVEAIMKTYSGWLRLFFVK